MHLPLFEVPFAPPTKFIDSGWNLEPTTGIAGASKILLIDPRAQSFSESMVGYFAAHAKGLVVGEPTSGANGVLSQVQLPDGYLMRFTGMVVTTHKGRRFHALGFLPNITVRPTAAGIASGRDEVLEKAIEYAKVK